LPAPARRLLALAILAAGILLVWTIVLGPVFDVWSNAAAATGRSARLLAAYRKTIDDAPRSTALLHDIETGPYAGFFIDASDPDLAGTKLQQTIKQLTEAATGEIRSIQVLPPGKDHGLSYVSVRTSFSISVMQLKELLEKYDEDRPTLFVDNLVITAPETIPTAEAKPVLLSVNCTLSAYLRPVAP
jgi:hypothetical protein